MRETRSYSSYRLIIRCASPVLKTDRFVGVPDLLVKRDGNSIKARWELTMKQNRIQRKDYKEFYETIEEARKKTVWQVTFTRQKIDKEGIALEKAVKEKPEEVPSLVKLARHYLTRGKYEEAKELLEKVVNLDPNSGEVRYFLGMALTYLEQYEEGAAEMEKAEELGYEP